jgi:hypothetical protein
MLTLEYNMIGRYEVDLNDTPYAPTKCLPNPI